MFSNWMLQSKEFNPENFNASAITLKQHVSKQELHGEIMGNLAHQSPRGNMHKLLGCVRTSLKRFLACLTFHGKEIRLRHLYKRTNPGSAPAIIYADLECLLEKMHSCQNNFEKSYTKKNNKRNEAYAFWLFNIYKLFI